MSDPSALTILPLGGCGEVGLNATLFVYEGSAILLDCGAFLGAENPPGVNKVVPGFEPLFRFDRRLLGVVLTHGHEDHIGALPALLAERDVPVFASPFTADLVKSRLERDGPVAAEARAQMDRITEVPLGGRFTLGPFRIELVRVTHSVPDSAAVVIDTPAGRIVHTGDFRLDPDPLDGRPSDLARFAALGLDGVDVLMSDSTNSEVPGRGRSEREVATELERQVRRAQGRVVVTLMGSHVHRMAALAEVARRTDKKLCVLGRTLERNWALAVARGLLPSDPHLMLAPERLTEARRDRVIVIASGSQGEFGSGLARIAAAQEQALRMQRDETVILSARTIPGNELSVRRILNQLARQGVRVVGPDEAPVHASGHARAEEQADLIRLVRPRWFVPVYGERLMMETHARTAEAAGVDPRRIRVIENGQTLEMFLGHLERGSTEEVSRRPLDDQGKVMDWGDVRDRSRIGRSGLLACSVAIDRTGRLAAEPVLTARGFRLDDGQRVELAAAVRQALDDPYLISRDLIEDAAKSALLGRLGAPRHAPQVEVLLVALDPRVD